VHYALRRLLWRWRRRRRAGPELVAIEIEVRWQAQTLQQPAYAAPN
jgi:hypothetical protein